MPLRGFPGLGVFPAAGTEAIAGTRIVVLAVKPQQMRAACAALAPHVAAVPVVLSIAAGTRSTDVARWLGGYGRIVRAMPNTPALVGKGVTGVYARDEVDAASRQAAVEVLEAGGDVLWVQREEQLDAVTINSLPEPSLAAAISTGATRPEATSTNPTLSAAPTPAGDARTSARKIGRQARPKLEMQEARAGI